MTIDENRNSRSRLVIGIIAFFVFCFIAWNVSAGRTEGFDTAVDHSIYELRGPGINTFFKGLTHIGDWQVIVGAFLVLTLWKKTRSPVGIPAAVTGIVGVLSYMGLKMIFQRPRPDESLRLIPQGGFSFPSGHSLNSVVCFGILIYLIWRIVKAGSEGGKESIISPGTARVATVILVALPFAIMFSRVFLGVHYITDVLAGGCMGLFILMMATLIWDRYLPGLEGNIYKIFEQRRGR